MWIVKSRLIFEIYSKINNSFLYSKWHEVLVNIKIDWAKLYKNVEECI